MPSLCIGKRIWHMKCLSTICYMVCAYIKDFPGVYNFAQCILEEQLSHYNQIR